MLLMRWPGTMTDTANVPPSSNREQVWLNTQNYSTDQPMKKLDHQWIGPFKILKVVSPAALKLQLTLREKGIHPVVSVSNIRPYIPNDIPE